MEKFSFNLFIFAGILVADSEMMAEARGPIILCRCSKIEDCQGICAVCPNYNCINNLCTCLSGAPPFQ
ncbi:hypothetical protein ES319_A12G157000v1 [Gossypium barbadense]|uniref:Uncharacterized protein n=3 Tax=Gossypium TaxID=3633 RepID=A0A5J5TAU1_GOSBA|nr:hypothetical protein ES319_A12G157000v1 [Gossypium barbadense]TYG90310.1 hypothetical protein ES288_A12G171100v1 [Gossypium darwinii]TYH96351.1 hypothetical protein ES332_A12G170900v1 [Gossypium tomentosum]